MLQQMTYLHRSRFKGELNVKTRNKELSLFTVLTRKSAAPLVSLGCLFFRSFVRSFFLFVFSFVCSFVCSFVRSFVCLFVRS